MKRFHINYNKTKTQTNKSKFTAALAAILAAAFLWLPLTAVIAKAKDQSELTFADDSYITETQEYYLAKQGTQECAGTETADSAGPEADATKTPETSDLTQSGTAGTGNIETPETSDLAQSGADSTVNIETSETSDMAQSEIGDIVDIETPEILDLAQFETDDTGRPESPETSDLTQSGTDDTGNPELPETSDLTQSGTVGTGNQKTPETSDLTESESVDTDSPETPETLESTESESETDPETDGPEDPELDELARDIALDQGYAETIDLSTTITGGTDYRITGFSDPLTGPTADKPAVSDRALYFTKNANNKTYKITQSVTRKNPSNPAAPKEGTCIFFLLDIPDGVNITLVISGIDMNGSISIGDKSSLTLLIDGTNYIRNSIEVPAGAKLTIDSLSGNETKDSLIMPSSKPTEYAKIGGRGGGNAGTIIIDGGTINITAKSTGAGIGGGGCSTTGTGVGGNGGTTTINGGIIHVTQMGPENYHYSGACIGGGAANKSIGGGGGTITINDGALTIRQYTQAAGIGGGALGSTGEITINGGIVDARVICESGDVGSGDGSAIGASSGVNTDGISSVTINGGIVTAIGSDRGGPGIGIANGGKPCRITITGGTVYAKGITSAGIGCRFDDYGTTITITGGTVLAESDNNAGIGGPIGKEPALHLSASADVKAYSGGETPAINTRSNTGNGYFVNASFENAISTTIPTALYVFKAGGETLLKTLTLPTRYKNFAYSSDMSRSRTDNIYAEYRYELKSIVRSYDLDKDIYSILKRNGYNAHSKDSDRGVLPVKFSVNAYCMITEKYVGIDGLSIGKEDTYSFAYKGFTYSKNIPPIDEYTVLGYKLDSAPDDPEDYTAGDPTKIEILKNSVIYFIYGKGSTLTISKTVEGDYGNKIKEFAFTVSFYDDIGEPMPSGKTFNYTGAAKAGSGATAPASGVLTLDYQGEATVYLSHGQRITITDVPVDCSIQIKEAITYGYTPSFTDSEVSGSGDGWDTGVRKMTNGNRTFDFVNTRELAVTTGFKSGNAGAMLLPPLLSLLTCLAYIAARKYHLCRKQKRTFS